MQIMKNTLVSLAVVAMVWSANGEEARSLRGDANELPEGQGHRILGNGLPKCKCTYGTCVQNKDDGTCASSADKETCCGVGYVCNPTKRGCGFLGTYKCKGMRRSDDVTDCRNLYNNP